MNIDEGHAAGEAGDNFGNAILKGRFALFFLSLAPECVDVALENGREVTGLGRGVLGLLLCASVSCFRLLFVTASSPSRLMRREENEWYAEEFETGRSPGWR
ncbi:hypothetical protein ACFQY9_17725 [Microvirga aerilata]|uniref:hypothetical protein n=1 Tax=Microvirga aerilata TaxID=670292 RepID=UPI00363A34D0